MNDTDQPVASDRVVCPAAKDPVVRLLIGAAMALTFGLWMVYDHYFQGKYPKAEPSDINKYAGYLLNHFGPFVLIPVGLVLVVWGIGVMRRGLVADAEGIGYRGGARWPWTDIASVDASRLKGKGILVLHSRAGGKLLLDSWKLMNFKDLVVFVEAHLPPDIHIGT
jgi:hypothetical protein